MNTYEQDELIPIYIFLSYGKNVLKLPINPENLKTDRGSESETEEIEGLGQIGEPSTPKLAKIAINSFFWHEADSMPAALYVAWIRKWQKSKQPAKLVVTRFNYSMQVTCEYFNYDTRAGEEKDVYYELSLQEYRPYGAKYLRTETNQKLITKVTNWLGKTSEQLSDVPLVLVGLPRPNRNSTLKEEIGNTYTAVSPYLTITAISKKITGSAENWKEIYDENRDIFGDMESETREVKPGTIIKVPSKYVTKSQNTVINGGF